MDKPPYKYIFDHDNVSKTDSYSGGNLKIRCNKLFREIIRSKKISKKSLEKINRTEHQN